MYAVTSVKFTLGGAMPLLITFQVGTRYGKKKLPFSTSKSWAGSLAFFVCSIVGALFYVWLFEHTGWFTVSWAQYFPLLVVISFVAAVVEAAPVREWDNITVFVACVAVSRIFGY